jgi:hypothetical protein
MYRFGCIELKINLCSIQAPAAELSGRAGDHFRSSSYGVSANRERSRHSEAAAEFRCSFEEEVKKQLVRIHVFKKTALKWTRSVCLRAP